MREKQLHKTLGKRGDELSDLIGRIGAGFDMDIIHHFRTSVKKWRALLRAFSDPKGLFTKPFKKLVHISGELRNLQVLLADAGVEAPPLDEFRKWLKALLDVQENAWKEHYHVRTIKQQLHKAGHPDYKACKQGRTASFCRQRRNRIKGILCLHPPSDQDLHSARKMIKDMEYLVEWAAKKDPAKDYAPELSPLQRIARQAGQFNDKRIALELLNTYLREKGPSGLNEGIAAIRQQWEVALNKKRKTLLNALKRYVSVTRP